MSKEAAYIENKKTAVLDRLEKTKWWQKTFDDRPLEPGDITKTLGREELPVYFLESGLPKELAELGLNLSFRIQSGFTYTLDDSMEFKFTSDVFAIHINKTIRIPAAVANDHLAAKVFRLIHHLDTEIVTRANPLSSDNESLPTNYEVFAQNLAELESIGVADFFDDLAKRFRAQELGENFAEELEEFIPILNWSKRYATAEEKFSTVDGLALNYSLELFAREFEESGIDPETNQIDWQSPTIWRRGDFSIVDLDSEKEIIRQGKLIDHCVSEIEDQPYAAMVEAGNWKLYGLHNKVQRPVATICAAWENSKTLHILENRGRASLSLAPNGQRDGRSVKYAQIIDAWVEELEGQGCTVIRETENEVVPTVHQKFGIEASGYHDFDYGRLIEPPDTTEWPMQPRWALSDGRQKAYLIYDMTSLNDYIQALASNQNYFIDANEEPDYGDEVIEYDPGAKVDVRIRDITVSLPFDLVKDRSHSYEEIVRMLTGLHVAAKHQDLMEETSHQADDLMDLLLENIEDIIDSADDFQASEFRNVDSSQLSLSIRDDDTLEWARKLKEMTMCIFSLDVDDYSLPVADGVVGFDFNAHVEESLRHLKGIEKTFKSYLKPEERGQGQLFAPAMNNEEVVSPDIASTNWRRADYHSDQDPVYRPIAEPDDLSM